MKLFGGAISADIPSTFLDASDLREIPDHQEVFVGTSNEQNASLIIELLESVKKPSLLDALAYHIDELHRVSNTNEEHLQKAVEVEQTTLQQHETVMRVDILTENNKKTAIVFALFQLKQFNTDVFITCSLEEKSGVTVGVDSQFQVIRDIITSFKIDDPSLFQ